MLDKKEQLNKRGFNKKGTKKMPDVPRSSFKKNMILSVDIETSGPSVRKNGILAIGFCVGDMVGNVIKKERINVALDTHHAFDETCVVQFWDKPGPAKVLKDITVNPLPPKQAIAKFAQIVDVYDTLFALTVISDNPTFDLYFINYYMELYLDRKPLNYKFGKVYRKIVDSKSVLQGYGIACKRENIPPRGVPWCTTAVHDHYPENDAEFIYCCYLRVFKSLK